MPGRAPEADGEPIPPGDAFALLGNETRMDILQTLWDAREPFDPASENALSFSELRERVGMEDPGQFNYHLNRLVDQFVRRTDAGYVLRPNAVKILRAVVTGSVTGVGYSLQTNAETPCPLCGSLVEIIYANEQLVARCTECEGEYITETSPDGTLMSSPMFPPIGIGDRTGDELFYALVDHMATRAFGFLRGVCPECASQPTTSVDVCLNHEPDGICEQCGSSQVALATSYCETCTMGWRVPAWIRALTHPDVIAFFHNHGINADGGLTLDAYMKLLTARETVLSEDPLRLDVTVELDGDECTVTIDESLSVIDVRS